VVTRFAAANPTDMAGRNCTEISRNEGNGTQELPRFFGTLPIFWGISK
jgi:hypothetical protein